MTRDEFLKTTNNTLVSGMKIAEIITAANMTQHCPKVYLLFAPLEDEGLATYSSSDSSSLSASLRDFLAVLDADLGVRPPLGEDGSNVSLFVDCLGAATLLLPAPGLPTLPLLDGVSVSSSIS